MDADRLDLGRVPAPPNAGGFAPRCYNAAMSRPFQFSMRQIFIIAALVCIATPSLKSMVAMSDADGFFISGFFIIGGAFIGALIGYSFDKPVAGAIFGFCSGLVVIAGILLVCRAGGPGY